MHMGLKAICRATVVCKVVASIGGSSFGGGKKAAVKAAPNTNTSTCVSGSKHLHILPYIDLSGRHMSGAAVACRWLYSVADDFFTKQLPHNVTWGLTVLYALDASKDLTDLNKQV